MRIITIAAAIITATSDVALSKNVSTDQNRLAVLMAGQELCGGSSTYLDDANAREYTSILSDHINHQYGEDELHLAQAKGQNLIYLVSGEFDHATRLCEQYVSLVRNR